MQKFSEVSPCIEYTMNKHAVGNYLVDDSVRLAMNLQIIINCDSL